MKASIEYIITDYLTMQDWEIEWSNLFEEYTAKGSLYSILTKKELKQILEEIECEYSKEIALELIKEIETKEGGN